MRKWIHGRVAATIIVSAIVTLGGATMLVHRAAQARHSQALFTPAPSENRSEITILGTGDLLVHPPTWKQAVEDATGSAARYDFSKILAGTAPDVRAADLAFCHMEAPLAAGSPQDFPRFRVPVELAAAVRETGYDGCSTASNHALDQDAAGVQSNIKALDAAGLGHTGTYAVRAGAGAGQMYTVKGVKIGHLSYAYGMNKVRTTTWMVNTVDVKSIVAAAKRLRTDGAAIIVLSLHGGREYDHQPSPEQRSWVAQLIASPDIDLILGHHAHVVQPFQKIGGKWVAFGLGNALARHDRPTEDNRAGVMGRFTFARNAKGQWVAVKAEAIMTWLSLRPELRVVTLPRAIRSLPSLDARRRKYGGIVAVGAVYLDALQAVNAGLVIDGSEGSKR